MLPMFPQLTMACVNECHIVGICVVAGVVMGDWRDLVFVFDCGVSNVWLRLKVKITKTAHGCDLPLHTGWWWHQPRS